MSDERSHALAIDELLARYLKQPVRVSWEGPLGEALLGRMREVRLELRGISTASLPVEELCFTASTVRITPGLPGQIALQGLGAEVTVGQRDVDAWTRTYDLPLRLVLGGDGLTVRGGVGGVEIGDFEVEVEVRGGWFVLKPHRASLLGVPNPFVPLFRSYLPLPPLASGARLARVDHAAGELTAAFALGDVEEALTPGLLDRLQRRFLSFA